MRIFLDNSGYYLNNMGDVAMLQAAIARLQALWPEACIDVITDDPQRLAELCPGTRAVSATGRFAWFGRGNLLGLAGRYAHRLGGIGQVIQRQERRLRWSRPEMARSVILKRRRGSAESGLLQEFAEALYAADFVIASGGGYITDTFPLHALCVLDTMRLAQQMGKPTAMLGQGIGPLTDRELLASAGVTLPRVRLITLREAKMGLPLLQQMGVSPESVVTTGDDAIEMAYCERPQDLGTGIGVNLRIADYSHVEADLIPAMRGALQQVAQDLKAELLPVPIAFAERESDVATIRQLIAREDEAPDTMESLQNPHDIIRQTSRCRVMVTGSYHAAVFALAQGIPAVGLVKSAYYDQKFQGLAQQFGVGCASLRMDGAGFPERLQDAVKQAWEQAPGLRATLLAAAERQIQEGRQAYRRLPLLWEQAK